MPPTNAPVGGAPRTGHMQTVQLLLHPWHPTAYPGPRLVNQPPRAPLPSAPLPWPPPPPPPPPHRTRSPKVPICHAKNPSTNAPCTPLYVPGLPPAPLVRPSPPAHLHQVQLGHLPMRAGGGGAGEGGGRRVQGGREATGVGGAGTHGQASVLRSPLEYAGEGGGVSAPRGCKPGPALHAVPQVLRVCVQALGPPMIGASGARGRELAEGAGAGVFGIGSG